MATLKTKLTLDMKGFRRGLKRASMGVKRFSRNIGQPLVQGIRNVTRLTAAVGALGAAFAVMGLKAAGRLETLQERLRTVSVGAEDFERSWKSAQAVFLTSPLNLEPLVEAETLMKSFGVSSEENLRAAASAAVAMGRPIQDIAMAIGSMETEPLRRLGIQARKAGDNFTFAFRDKAGKAIEMTATGLDDARQVALDIMRMKFGGSLERMAKTWQGALSTLGGLRTMALSQMFDEIRGKGTGALVALNDKLLKLLNAGYFKKLGARIADFATRAATWIFNLGKAIHDFAKATDVNLGKMAVLFAATFIAFKTGLAVPLIRAAIAMTKGLATALVGPLGAILVSIATLFASFKLGKIMADSMDLSHHIAVVITEFKGMGRAIAAIFKSIGPNFSEEFNRRASEIANDVDRELNMLDTMRDRGAMDFGDRVKAELDKTVEDAKRIGKKIGDALIPDSVKGLIEDLGNLGKPIDMPKLDLTMPEGMGERMEGAVGRGIVRGLSNSRWGRVFTGAAADGRVRLGRTDTQKLYQERKRELQEQKKQTGLLQNIADNSGAAWSFA